MNDRVDETGFRTSMLLVSGAVVVVVVGVVGTFQRAPAEPPPWSVLLVFGVLIALGELFRVQLPGGRDAAPIGTALGLAMALLPELGRGNAPAYGAEVVVVVVVVATGVGIAPYALTGRGPGPDVLARRLIAVSLAAWIWREVPIASGKPLVELALDWGEHRWALALSMAVVAMACAALDLVAAAVVRADAGPARLQTVLRDEMRAGLAVSGAVAATGVLIALAGRPMGLVALPVFAAPLLLSQLAFRRYSGVSSTYRQTIRSLSRLTDLGGYTETGHAVRVADLSLAMGRELGMDERQLRDLEFAALMHDIGQLSLTDPIPGGATLLAAPVDQRRIAGLGADIVRQTGVMDQVALIVERQPEPYRTRLDGVRGASDEAVPLASRIIKVANAYDDLVGDVDGVGRRMQAQERIHLGLAFEYDPRVVGALTRVLARRFG